MPTGQEEKKAGSTSSVQHGQCGSRLIEPLGCLCCRECCLNAQKEGSTDTHNRTLPPVGIARLCGSEMTLDTIYERTRVR